MSPMCSSLAGGARNAEPRPIIGPTAAITWSFSLGADSPACLLAPGQLTGASRSQRSVWDALKVLTRPDDIVRITNRTRAILEPRLQMHRHAIPNAFAEEPLAHAQI